MTWYLGLLLALAALASVALIGCNDRTPARASLTINYSRFSPEVITAQAGRPITITLRNDDPIEHEWIAGPPAIHERHRTGTEPFHSQVPTEVTIPPFSTRETTVTFEEAAEYAFICHLPGHEAYGMVGTLRVIE